MVTAKDVPPGGVGEIKTTFKTKGYQGPVKKTITVETNDPENKMVRLTLSGNVVSDVTVEPRYLNFGSVTRNAPPKPVPLTIALLPGKDLRITEVRSESESLVLSKESEDKDKNRTTYLVSLAERLPVGRLTGRIVVKTTSKTLPEVQVPFHASVLGDVRVTPQLLALGMVRPGEKITRDLILTGTGGSSFSVEKIVPTVPNLSTSIVAEKEGERVRIVVTYDPGSRTEGRVSERLTLFVKSGAEEIIEVPVYGTFQSKNSVPPTQSP